MLNRPEARSLGPQAGPKQKRGYLLNQPEVQARNHGGQWHVLSPTAGLLAIITIVTYLPVLRCGFIWDDDSYLLLNQTLRSVEGLGQIWFETRATPQYYPLVFTSFWLEYHIWGFQPIGYHLVNVLLHVGVVLLLWRLLERLEVPGAWAAAAVFALHPVHVESVAWITERKNVLSGVFYFASAIIFLRAAGLWGKPSVSRSAGLSYAASLLLFLCALLSKTVTCTLPAVLLLVIWWRQGRVRRTQVLALLPMFAIGAAMGLLTAWLEREHVGSRGAEWGFTLVERSLIAGRVMWFYVGKLFWPHPLVFIYPRWQIQAGDWVQYLYPLAALALVVVLWILRKRIGTGPLVAALCFGGTLLPASGFFNVYPMRYSFVADHFQYIASIPVIVLAVAVVHWLAGKVGSKNVEAGRISILVACLGTMAILTWHRVQAFNDLEVLWRDTLAKNPGAWMARLNLGVALNAKGKLDEAIDLYRRMLADPAILTSGEPDDFIPNIKVNLGKGLLEKGRTGEAILLFNEAVSLKPDLPNAHYNLGVALQRSGEVDRALAAYRRVIELQAAHPGAHGNTGGILQERGQLDEAAEHYLAALKVLPHSADLNAALGEIDRRRGRLDEAMARYQAAEKASRGRSAVLAGMAWVLAVHPDAAVRKPDQAVRLAEQAAGLTNHRDAAILDILAAAYASAGRFEEAVKTERSSIAFAAASGMIDLARQGRARLELYLQGKAYLQAVPASKPA